MTGLLAVLFLISVAATAAPKDEAGALAVQSTPTEVIFQQGVDNYTGCDATYIDLYYPDANLCQNQFLLVSGNSTRSALLRFDVSTIPADATVLEAYLEAYAHPESGVNPLEAGAFGLWRDWAACEATWLSATTTIAWQTPGALGVEDRAAVAADKEILAGPGWYYFNVTKWVQNWVLNPNTNHGLGLFGTDPRYAELYKFVSTQNPTVELRPRLRVKYVLTGQAPAPVPIRQMLPTGVMTFQQGLDCYMGAVDTWIDSNAPGANYDSGQLLLVRSRLNTSSLLRFDLSALPAQIVLVEAYLQLRASEESSVLPMHVASYAVKRPWLASEATWLNATAGQTWEEAGCRGPTDRAALPSDRENLHGAGWWQFNVTDIVQQWLEHNSENNGFLLESPDETSATTYKFISSNHVDTVSYPLLIVRYALQPATPTPTVTATATEVSPTATATVVTTHTPVPTATPPRAVYSVYLPVIFKAR